MADIFHIVRHRYIQQNILICKTKYALIERKADDTA
jgi:hypothetical protein